ncbi:MAG TPA: LamG domain-containing protein [Chitinophagaceae bacterium]|nr:LamG domain-containing protein [Chitinophagaceae bacterium]
MKRNTLGTTLNNFGKAFFVGDLNNAWGIGVVNNHSIFITKVGVNAVTSTTPLNDTIWHHVAVVYTGTQINFYIDGNSAGSAAYSSSFGNTGGNYFIGARQSFGNGNGDQTPDAYLDEMRLWRNVALSQTQIRDWMCRKVNSNHPAYSNLFAYFRLDESSGNISGGYNGNYGVLINSPVRSLSAAPLGDAAAHDYVNTVKNVSLSHQSGETFTATSASGSPSAIHVYRVDEQPNTLNGTTGVGGNNKYFGVFQVGGSAPLYNAVYNYDGNPFVTPAVESTLRLFKRNSNASGSWNVLSVLPNEPANTLTSSASNAEFIMGKTGAPFQSPLNLTLFLQGYYNNSIMAPVLMNQGIGSSSMLCDTITVSLYQTAPPYTQVYSTSALLQTNGSATCNMPVIPGYYYLGIRHRNSLETWSADPIPVNSSVVVNYNFSAAASKAYGDNQIELKPGIWGLYSGDLNQEENIDLLDAVILEAEVNNFSSGYQVADINGDGNVDLLDSPILELNISNFIFSEKP